jgi:hypothetical protein
MQGPHVGLHKTIYVVEDISFSARRPLLLNVVVALTIKRTQIP